MKEQEDDDEEVENELRREKDIAQNFLMFNPQNKHQNILLRFKP